MSDQVLRSNLIRLASEKPELRAHLLPLLKQAATDLTTVTLPIPFRETPHVWEGEREIVRKNLIFLARFAEFKKFNPYHDTSSYTTFAYKGLSFRVGLLSLRSHKYVEHLSRLLPKIFASVQKLDKSMTYELAKIHRLALPFSLPEHKMGSSVTTDAFVDMARASGIKIQ